jgi:hypothetical protein
MCTYTQKFLGILQVLFQTSGEKWHPMLLQTVLYFDDYLSQFMDHLCFEKVPPSSSCKNSRLTFGAKQQHNLSSMLFLAVPAIIFTIRAVSIVDLNNYILNEFVCHLGIEDWIITGSVEDSSRSGFRSG